MLTCHPPPRPAGGLLHRWQRRNLDASLPLALRQLEDAGNLDNVRLAIQAAQATRPRAAVAESDGTTGADGYGAAGGHRPVGVGPVDPLPGTGYRGPVFMDSDIYKTLEAIGWELAHGARPELGSFAARVTALLEEAQRPDGYLNSYFQVSGESRYARLAWSHEMYCAGHLIQAAVALHRGTGDGRLLAVAVRLADHLVREFAGRDRGLDGHPVIETALAELYRETGAVAYLELARQFVDQRGRGLAGDSGLGRRYLQDHLPVRQSATEVGHVVRALYLEARGLALRVPAWSASARVSVNNDPERTEVSPGYHILHRPWRPGDVVTLRLDVTPRWTYPDRRVDAVRGCVAIERGPLVYCFEQVDQLDGARLDDLAVKPGGVLGERPVTLAGVGQTIEITVPSVPQTAVAIPYFQWDNRDGGPMRVWMPCWPRGDDPPGTPR